MFLKVAVLLSVQPLYFCFVLKHNNVCKSSLSYYYPEESINCYHDPDLTLSVPDIIRKYTGILEVHNVTSQDGYILSLFRIPRKNPKGVILIHHSIATSSQIYLWQGNTSFAITLWRQGFDVWLANQRGTSYSSQHVNLTSSHFSYWNFSTHEMGMYDVPRELQLIRTKTNNSKIIYMGHSLGAAIGLVYASSKTAQAKSYLEAMVLLSAPAYLKHVTSSLILFTHLIPTFKMIVESLEMGSAYARWLPLVRAVSRVLLRVFPSLLYIANVILWSLCGYTPEATDPAFFNFDAVIFGDNFSWKTIFHFFQISTSKRKFQMYDYGREQNLRIYGEAEPPLYPIGNISVPTLLVSSYQDKMITMKDSEDLFKDMSPEAKVHGHWKLSGLNHLDFLVGKYRNEIFFDKLVHFLTTLQE